MPRLPPKTLTTRERALGLLARREQSQRELKRKLVGRGAAKEEAEQTIESLADSHLQSNDRFAAMMVRRRVADGHGPLRISAELASHGISREIIRAALEEESPDWTLLASQIYRRKFGQLAPDDRKERIKRASWLAQRGFPSDIAKRIAAIAEADDEL
jgi:regulatory protein